MNHSFRRSLLLSSVVLFATPLVSFAQVSTPAPAKPAPLPALSGQSMSWSGPYIGLNAGITGGSFAHSPIEMEALKPNEPQELTQNRIRNSAAGGFFGAQIGYLYQFQNNVVLGAEADFQIGPYLTSGTEHEISSETNTRESELAKFKTSYFGTLRARLGCAIGPVLPYVTGGLAFGRTQTMFAEGEPEPGKPASVTSGKTNWGYAVGAGVEYAIAPAWRLKAEYLYTSLSSYQAQGLENVTFKLPTSFNLARIGVNYAFGAPSFQPNSFYPQPAIGEGAPRFDGFSIGVNAGITAGISDVDKLKTEDTQTTQKTEKRQASGGLAGFEIGYHYKFANNVVVGAVADYQWTNYGVFSSESEQSAAEAEREKLTIGIPQFGTVRARVGYQFGSFMPYITGGLAYGRATYREAVMPLEAEKVPATNQATKTGYAVGAGIEYALTSQIALKVEYLFVDLGTISAFSSETGRVKAPLDMNIGRVGISYHF